LHAQAGECLTLKGEARTASNDRFAESRRQADIYLEEQRSEMRNNGYIEATRAQLAVEAAILSKEDQFRPSTAALGPLTFTPLSFDRGPLKHAQYVGAYDRQGALALTGDNSSISQVTHVLQHKELGRIFVDEYSFATDDSLTQYAISAPSNNIYVSGYPADYFVVRDRKNLDIGFTEVEFCTGDKHIHIRVFQPIAEYSSDFKLLEEIANSLAL
jgi:hypothetical protein